MVNPSVAFQRSLPWLKSVCGAGVTERDFVPITYTNAFERSAANVTADVMGQLITQTFPAKATLVLGIQGSAYPTTQPAQPMLPGNQRYSVSMQYNVNQLGLVVPQDNVGGVAEAVFGAYGDQFPVRELQMVSNLSIAVTVQANSCSDTTIKGSIIFHCLAWAYAQ